ncbi:MAG: glycosyltransferase family 4 protein [Candidatus Aminicenantes bacterium]|nr:glycosyltransferase family 4 protein [Candidatus Aminicenantes bacterium]
MRKIKYRFSASESPGRNPGTGFRDQRFFYSGSLRLHGDVIAGSLEVLLADWPEAVVSAIPGNLAVVSDEFNGLVVPVDDPDAFAAAILRLLEDPQLRARLRTQARQRMIDHFSITVISARVHDLYLQLASPAE